MTRQNDLNSKAAKHSGWKSLTVDLNILSVLLHVAGDVINNVGVMISASIIIWCDASERFYADPALSMCIAMMLMGASIPIVLKAGRILLQASPNHINPEEVRMDLMGIEGIQEVRELHIWKLNAETTVASAHVALSPNETLSDWMKIARRLGECFNAYGVHSYTLQPGAAVHIEEQGMPVVASICSYTSRSSLDRGTSSLQPVPVGTDLQCCNECPG